MNNRLILRRTLVSGFVILSLVLCSQVALGQVTIGVIHGNVTDATGGVVPGATVTATNDETGLERTALSSDLGYYSFEALQPGVYTITAEMPGFKKYERQAVQLSVGERVRADIQLQIGEITESVVVTGGAVMVDTRSAEVSGLVDDLRITELPLSGRNVISLASLLPGISRVSAPQVQTGTRSGPVMTVHGGRDNQNYLTLNGTNFSHPSRNTMMTPPPPDAVREFRIKTNNFSAAEGRNSGAYVSVVTRGGTNEFHGSVWEFHRNDNLNARSFFQAQKSNRIMNQFGVAAGGPILRDKVHIFGSYEGFRDRPQPSSTGAFPPTAAERAGDFSHVSKQLVNPYTGEAFEGNQVPTSLFDPVSVKILELVPLPNQPDGRLVTNNPAPNNNDLFMIRNDIQVSETQSLFWHYYYYKNESPERMLGNIPGWNTVISNIPFHNVGVSHTYTLSPTLVNSASFGFTKTDQDWINGSYRSTESLGMDFPNYTDYGTPRFSPTGRFSLTAASEWINFSRGYNVNESLSWTRGNHIFKIGGEFNRFILNQGWLSPPSFSFDASRSGDAMLDFMMGAFTTVSIGYGRRINDTYQPWHWAFFFQDEWRVTPRLTLTLGMRYMIHAWWNDYRDIGTSSVVFPLDESNVTSASVPGSPPGYLFAGYDLPDGLVETDKNNFAPRFGLAYDVRGDGRTSVRLGGGVFYDVANGETMAQTNPPITGDARLYNGQLSAPNAGITDPLPPVEFGPGSEFFFPLAARSVDQNLRSPYAYHWNLGVEHQLTRDLMVSVDYVGKIGRKWISSYRWNPAVYIPGVDENGDPNSTLGNAQDRVLYGKGILNTSNLMLAGIFDTWYHGMDATLNKRFSNGFSLLANYTFSKTITDKSTRYTDTSDVPNPFQIKASKRGLADFDRTHVFNVSALWTPVTAMEGPLGYLVAGWTLSPIFRYNSGTPLEFRSGQDRALDGTSGRYHPDLVGDPKKSHSSNDSKIAEWFNTSAFAMPAIGTYGTAGSGIYRGPSYINWDLGILKDFPIRALTEEARIQFRAELFNLFNHTHFGNPQINLSSSSFGRITSAYGPREVQFGLKFIW